MPRLILIALSEQDGTSELAQVVSQLDPRAIVIATADIPQESADQIINMMNDLVDTQA